MRQPRESHIERARSVVVQKIRTLDLLPDDSVIEHKAGNLLSKFDEALAKTNLAIIVGINKATEEGGQTARIEWAPVRLFVDVFESPQHQIALDGSSSDLPGAWAYAEELISALKLCALEDQTFPELADHPVEELETATDGALCVRFYLQLKIAGNSRTTTD